jgi:ABC-type proline/glycine betaine transport system permease subunit
MASAGDPCGPGQPRWQAIDRWMEALGRGRSAGVPRRSTHALLVAMAALLGAVLGVALALMVEHAETSRAVAALGRER